MLVEEKRIQKKLIFPKYHYDRHYFILYIFIYHYMKWVLI
jgi:hypothetical protein